MKAHLTCIGLVALQANSSTEDRAVATGARNVLRSLGGVVGVAISSAAQYAAMNAALRGTVPEWLRDQALQGKWNAGDRDTLAYQADIQRARLEGFRVIFAIQVPLVGLCLLASFFVADVVLKGDVEKQHSKSKNKRSRILGSG